MELKHRLANFIVSELDRLPRVIECGENKLADLLKAAHVKQKGPCATAQDMRELIHSTNLSPDRKDVALVLWKGLAANRRALATVKGLQQMLKESEEGQ